MDTASPLGAEDNDVPVAGPPYRHGEHLAVVALSRCRMGMPVTASQIRAAPVERPRDDHFSVLGPLDRRPVSGLQVEGRLVRAIHVERRRVVLVRDPPLAAYLAQSYR